MTDASTSLINRGLSSSWQLLVVPCFTSHNNATDISPTFLQPMSVTDLHCCWRIYIFSKGEFNHKGIENESAKLARWRRRRCCRGESVTGGSGALPSENFSKFGCFLLQSRHSSAYFKNRTFPSFQEKFKFHKVVNRFLITLMQWMFMRTRNRTRPERQHVFIFEIWQIDCKGKQKLTVETRSSAKQACWRQVRLTARWNSS